MFKQSFVLLFLILLLATSAVAQRIALSTGEDQSNNRSAFLNALVMECFNRMDIELDIQFVPHKRALEAACLGHTDGTFIRSELIAKTCPELIRVPVPLITSRVTAFATNSASLEKIDGWESLAPYRVAYIYGWQWADRYLPACKEIYQIKKKNSLLQFLQKGRADVAIYDEILGKEEIKAQGLDGIHILCTPLSVAPMYLYMNRSHADMVQGIAETLHEMECDGTYQAFRFEYLGD